MDTLSFITDRYKIDLSSADFLVKIGKSRWREMGRLFNDLGFKKGAEVGVYRGKFTAALAQNAPNLELTGVDAWTSYPGYTEYAANDLENDAYAEAMEMAKKHKNVKLIKAWSVEAADRFEDGSLDFVFIDANHDYGNVLADIAAWSRKVRVGGLVSGHDYIKSKKYNFEVIEAVNKWCSDNNIKHLFLWRDLCPSWMYVKE